MAIPDILVDDDEHKYKRWGPYVICHHTTSHYDGWCVMSHLAPSLTGIHKFPNGIRHPAVSCPTEEEVWEEVLRRER